MEPFFSIGTTGQCLFLYDWLRKTAYDYGCHGMNSFLITVHTLSQNSETAHLISQSGTARFSTDPGLILSDLDVTGTFHILR